MTHLPLPVFIAAAHKGGQGDATSAPRVLEIDFSGGTAPTDEDIVVNPAGLPAGTYRVCFWKGVPAGGMVGEVVVGSDDVDGGVFYVALHGKGGVGGTVNGSSRGGGGGGGGGSIVVEMVANTGADLSCTIGSNQEAFVVGGAGPAATLTASHGGAGGANDAAGGAAPGSTDKVGASLTTKLRYGASGGGAGADGSSGLAGGAGEGGVGGGSTGGASTGTAGGAGGNAGSGQNGGAAVTSTGGSASAVAGTPSTSTALGLAIISMIDGLQSEVWAPGGGGGGFGSAGVSGVGHLGGGDGGTSGAHAGVAGTSGGGGGAVSASGTGGAGGAAGGAALCIAYKMD